MSDLVLGLLVLGAVLFAGVLLYNRVQERAAQRAVAPGPHGDALVAVLAQALDDRMLGNEDRDEEREITSAGAVCCAAPTYARCIIVFTTLTACGPLSP